MSWRRDYGKHASSVRRRSSRAAEQRYSSAKYVEVEDYTVMSPLDGSWYNCQQLADLLQVDPSTIRRWRTSRPPQGPAFVQVSDRLYLYSSRDVETWLASRRVDPSQVA
jgi:hypothetical protein